MDLVEIARMRESLAEHRAAGEYLLQTARMVGDEDDHAIWHRSRAAWRDALAAMLGPVFPDRSLTALETPPTDTRSGWKQRYEAEVRTVTNGIALLGELERSLAGQPAPRPSTENEGSGPKDADQPGARPHREPPVTPEPLRLPGSLRPRARLRELATA